MTSIFKKKCPNIIIWAIFLFFSVLKFPEHHCRTRRNVELQPLLVVLNIQRVEVSKVRDAVVGKAVAAKFFRIGIEHHFVAARRYQEAIVGIGARR